MAISVLDLFTIGIGPSSSHSIGPMRAAGNFLERIRDAGKLEQCGRVVVRLFGSLALTGKGHGTDTAILLGLEGAIPEKVNPDDIESQIQSIRTKKKCCLPGGPTISFDEGVDLLFLRKETLPFHPNGMQFTAYDSIGEILIDYTCYSIGGGFVVDESDAAQDQLSSDKAVQPFLFRTGNDLLRLAAENGKSISDMMLANESIWRSEAETCSNLLDIWTVMKQCVERGCRQEGTLPGGLKVQRRAAEVFRTLSNRDEQNFRNPLAVLDWVNLFALAVSEENAAGSRVVTAPTNGAAGVIPSVLHYYTRFIPEANDDGVIRFLLTAGAIGILYKVNASISGAEVGCQGEIGVACSMAAGALTEVLGGTVPQVEMAAEIGMEHNLGLTCDPIGGLVQVPCIERCAMAAVKAINASTMALNSDGSHHVSLDRVIKTMRETGRDMLSKYKETSRGGLAVAVTEC
ncbi:L-serine ammonia-lyase [Bythopirellula goksoeyrii]|uniref:L-serine dehydratase n=1 Tax=Bythopirellula goksoeyrii TaxID=1400387 RepID=A0A5B9Q4H5_9BACT|nr:L-serine ammonia-lyase [Bythopirellula goksoeyrii]QEG33924.1 L-serine dehydratase 1 [Bythopirellula goksoeyrii]